MVGGGVELGALVSSARAAGLGASLQPTTMTTRYATFLTIDSLSWTQGR